MEGGADDDMADGMQCSDHPYRTNPHGICALCLQEKLGKLLSSSLPLPLRPSSSSSPPSPSSFRSDLLPPPSSSSSSSYSRHPSSSLSLPQSQPNNGYHHHSHRPRLLFLSTKKKAKKKPSVAPSSSSSSAATASSDVVFKRSKSTATPRRGRLLDDPGDSPRKRNGFWSFLHLSSKSSSSSVSGKKLDAKSLRDGNISSSGQQKEKCEGSSLGARKIDIVVEDDETCNSRQTSASSFERKVSRSRSVGCGSRSFSGDFFERISTGFGDCALRRVESQREGKPKVARGSSGGDHHHHHHSMKERARCAGLFSGFMMNSSSSSSSSSSYLVSSSNDDQTTGRKSESMALSQSRGRYWGWAFASPMRVFTAKPSNSKDVKNNATPNLSAIPSLLAVRG
ncbi:uncharacterized serine-rich protein C215.13-like [Neltuma alba]|uniref:uncharacterized serine-rich protein C215.13-like n=1 Tax=Neltuma alba TaxID=207710 RepID=UPI0010A4DEF5|nr:uncharacterized serine-rich protein C215.13-like [Prosopis alba]